ncbi:MAG TPA: ABC transporter permease [Bryobacteraceae bacterium]|nr:ABC transporter permease [Bryobacteraceae bacterium]
MLPKLIGGGTGFSLWAFFWRRRRDRDLDEEIRNHLRMSAHDRMERGETAEQAEAAARRELGNAGLIKEVTREMWGRASLDRLAQDLRYGIRMLRRSPGFTAVAVLSLALGIGANTAIFSVIDALMLRNLPVHDPERLAAVGLQGEPLAPPFPYPLFVRIRDGAQGFSDLSAISVTDRSNVTINGPGGGLDTGLVRVALVSGNYFSMLGVQPAMGRAFSADEDRVPGGHPLVVISDRYWQRAFARSSDVLGRTLSMNGAAFTIIGVMSRNFLGDWIGRPIDLWFPMAMQSQVAMEMQGFLTRGNPWIRIVGRLQPGVRREQAQASANAIEQQYQREIAGPNPPPQVLRMIAQRHLKLFPAGAGYSPLRVSFGQSLTILAIVVGLVLLIACANVASLLLARAEARQREMAVRLAVGAGQRRLIRQLLTESVLLAVMGGALGFIFSVWSASTLSTFSLGPTQLDSRAPSQWVSLDLHPDVRVFAFAAALCLLTGILFGLAPAFRGSRVSLAPSLTGRGASSDGGSRFRLGKLLVISQVALSVLLLIGAGLFLRTLRNLQAQDLGFDREHVLLVWTSLGQTGRQGESVLNFWRTVQERAASLPGVLSAGISNQGLLNGWDGGTPDEPMKIRGRTPRGNGLGGWRTYVSPGFFAAAGIQLLAGRDFTERDTATAHRVVIINQAMAHYYFGNDNPVGEYLWADGPGDWVEIVGVAKDFTGGTPRVRELELPYYSYRQFGHAMERMCLVVRTAGNPASMGARIREELHTLDAALPVLKIDTVAEQLSDVLVQERLMASLSGFFGGLGVLLACLGLYGVMSYTAARRTNEIGIRLALGAMPENVLRMVIRESLVLVLAGIAIGVPVALVATRLISTKLYGIGASDPLTISGAILLMIAVAAFAGGIPARRAANVDPMVALRYE